MPESTSIRALLRAWLVSGEAPSAADPARADALIEAAAAQGLVGLLHEAVHDDPRWPAPARQRLHVTRRALLGRGIHQLDLAERVRGVLAQAGLRVLPLKGAALVERLYDSAADRPMADVDLLVLERWDAARQVLMDGGFVPQERADHAWSLRDPASGLLVELHHGLTSCPRLHPIDAARLWERSRPGAGQVARVPAAEDLLVQLALHAAFQHGLVLSLVQWLDLRRLLEREPLDPSRLAECAAAAHAQAALELALATAGAVVAAPLESVLGVRPRVPRWLERRLTRPLEFVAPNRPALARLRWHLAAGRRRALLAGTLRPARGDAPAPSAWARVRLDCARVAGLASRWLRPRARRDHI